ncbi:Isoprenylcysteine carboxyl methyltransferase family-domain-containing protein [Cladorrhinum sp. PSN332]|nr:Isoprenylcysteine carboxyl methyltransferase family-domain-containing protein [Cladorrhinum sp. PSN332]
MPESTKTTGRDSTTSSASYNRQASKTSDADPTPSSTSPDRLLFPGHSKSLSGIAVRAFCLGIALTISAGLTLTILIYTSSPLWRLPYFIASLSLFHFLEFWTTAAYNTRSAEVGSFLLTANWPGYAIAHSFAIFECLVTNTLWPGARWIPFRLGTLLCLAGVALTLTGQVVRSMAMVQAGPSFNHLVQHQRNAGHVLVTTGIYSIFRHPSYFGFFWWALGTQLAMGNVISFMGYSAVLWKFFSTRIKVEEDALIRFFGNEYVDYRRRVGTKIPLVP